MPPRGYQRPSPVCIRAIPQRTAGEPSGAEPTYWVKWSSIWATRGSATWARTVPATLLQGRIRSTSASIDGRNAVDGSNMSRSEPTDRQKKWRSQIAPRRSARSWNRS